MKQGMRVVALLVGIAVALGTAAISRGSDGLTLTKTDSEKNSAVGSGTHTVVIPAQQADEVITLPAAAGEELDPLRANPDRGWRGESWCYVSAVSNPDPAMNLNSFFTRYQEYDVQLCQEYFYLNEFKDGDINAVGLRAIRDVFGFARQKGIRLIVRFAYEQQMHDTVNEASDEVMFRHMKQLAPILEQNKDVIHTVEAGFLGAWGEWHSYDMKHDEEALLRGVLQMVPDEIYVQVRYPGIKRLIPSDDPEYRRIGIHDDSFFGWRYVAAAATLNPGEPDWNQVINEAAYAPTGGEMFWGCESGQYGATYGPLAIQQFSAFRQTSFSIYHQLKEYLYDWVGDENVGVYSMRDWQTQEISADWLEQNRITYDPTWFTDRNGKPLRRTVFDFVTDHMGYRFATKELRTKGSLNCGGTLTVEQDLVNYGFAAGFNLNSGFALLDESGNVVSEVAAGDPSTWYNRNPDIYADIRQLTHSVSAVLTLPDKPGNYQLAFYLRNSAGTGARLANDLPYHDGYTVLCPLEVFGETVDYDFSLTTFDVGHFELGMTEGASDYAFTDLSHGFLSGKNETVRRPWSKGYALIDGVRVAVYTAHLHRDGNDKTSYLDACHELIDMMYREDYCIVAVEMNNTDELINIMKSAGLNVANGDRFGKMKSYMYDTENQSGTEEHIDNVFTTPNVRIRYAEVIPGGGSDHDPLTVYLSVDKARGSTKGLHHIVTDSDGYVAKYY